MKARSQLGRIIFTTSEILGKVERETMEDTLCLSNKIRLEHFPLHRLVLFITIRKISISEAAVERAFARYRLMHSLAAEDMVDT